ncbi:MULTISPECIES: SCO family protein [Paracoccus]|uniref:SCO family protein n=1 Tax=Paracoccus TaxID=265 RepID=UPI0022405F8B|nr:SCO family protein [Paracoccus beibuensis]
MLKKIRIALWVAVAVSLVGVGALLWRADRQEQAAAFKPEFSLPDEAGTVRTAEEFRGKHLLVFFGFTNCPDVCPTTMAEVAQVMDDLGPEAEDVQPLFISVDPARDRESGLGEYLAAFHPSILGLAGDKAATKSAVNSFKVFGDRQEDASAPGGYTMSHSSSLYLLGPRGEWLRQFEYGTPADDIIADLKGRL